MSSRPFRVRFAPSPTGYFHVGGARTALYNWILARQAGGTFVLRIEDTDEARNRPEWTQGIIDALAWIGVEPGTYEGPHMQSTFAPAHLDAARALFDAGDAYYCDCSQEVVRARIGKDKHGYDGFCRDRGLGPAEGRPLRFKVPRPGTTTVVDLIRGEPVFDHDTIEDFVLLRGNGTVVFLLANVVDDITMRISHVLRAEEHLPNTPKQQLLWRALGAEPPVWAHVPLLVNEKRQKLSKRRDPVAMEMYRDEGYLAEAMKNYLMLLGWNPPGDAEIVPWSLIEDSFRLDDVNSSPAFFDVRKLRAFNAEYIRALSPAAFTQACRPWLTGAMATWSSERFDPAAWDRMVPLVQTRVEVLGDVPAMIGFLFKDVDLTPLPAREPSAPVEPVDLAKVRLEPVRPSLADWTKAMAPPAAALLDDTIATYAAVSPWSAEALKHELELIASTHDVKLRKVDAPVRMAVTGALVGPPLFDAMEVLGRDATVRRLQAARERL
jgi:glutamyl-tRNA synthetase